MAHQVLKLLTTVRCHKKQLNSFNKYLLLATFETDDNYSIRFEMKKTLFTQNYQISITLATQRIVWSRTDTVSSMLWESLDPTGWRTNLHAELPLTSDFHARNWSKVIWRHQGTLLATSNTRHTLQVYTNLLPSTETDVILSLLICSRDSYQTE